MLKGNIKLNSTLHKSNYIWDKKHCLIQNSKLGVKNIGLNGENLTIVIVSLNRFFLTIRLIESIKEYIPNFKGEIFIVDNGSDSKEILKLKSEMKKINFKNFILELNDNNGPSFARNTAMKYIRTDWALSLDNDIYLIDNPIKEIHDVIYKFGCHFLNLPLLYQDKHKIYALGGHIYIYDKDSNILISGGNPYEGLYDYNNFEEDAFLSTFLYAGASVINKNTFLQLGGYDEKLFVFEDVDFSLRLFQKGMKIGNCSKFFLVHDHKKPEKHLDKDYEIMRHSQKIYSEAEEYFRKKHGMSVLHEGVNSWLEERHNELDINLEKEKNTKFYINEEKPKVSIIIPCKNEGENLKETIDSIISCKSNFTFELIVVDDNSEDNSISFLQQFNYDVNLINTEGIGCSRAKNEGAKLAKAEYLFFCDAHIKVSDYWIDTLVYSLKDFDADLVSPCICDMKDNNIKIYGGNYDNKMNFKWILDKPQSITEIPLILGGAMGITKKAFEDIGGFDNLFKGYGLEDQDISIKAWLYDYKIIINPNVEVKHIFKNKHPYEIYAENIIYNTICMNYYHFKKERIEKTIEILKNYKSFHKSIKAIKQDLDNILMKRERYIKERKNNDDFFFEKFNIPF